MDFRLQFLDSSGNVIADWPCPARDAEGAVELPDGLKWPDGALRMQILDEDRRLVDWRVGPDDKLASGLESGAREVEGG